jgi:hypothetical protein
VSRSLEMVKNVRRIVQDLVGVKEGEKVLIYTDTAQKKGVRWRGPPELTEAALIGPSGLDLDFFAFEPMTEQLREEYQKAKIIMQDSELIDEFKQLVLEWPEGPRHF